VRRDGDPAAIGMPKALVGTFLADQIEAVPGEGADQFSGRERSKVAIVDRHGLDGDGDAGLILGNFLHLN
jgi:hypothetical protein